MLASGRAFDLGFASLCLHIKDCFHCQMHRLLDDPGFIHMYGGMAVVLTQRSAAWRMRRNAVAVALLFFVWFNARIRPPPRS